MTKADDCRCGDGYGCLWYNEHTHIYFAMVAKWLYADWVRSNFPGVFNG